MRKKGFTLIELLAVIVVLAVIAIIVIPVITNVIDKTKKGAFKDSILSAFDSIDYTLYQNKKYKLVDSININELNLKNNNFDGEFKKENNEIIAYYVTDGKYCAYGPKKKLIIAKSCSDIDVINPMLEVKLEKKVATITLKDNESGVVSYCVTKEKSISGCEWIDIEKSKEKEVTYEGKEEGTYYVFAKDSASNISESKEFILEQNLFCAYEVGKTWEYSYTGSEKNLPIPCNGNYKLETWGAQGGDIVGSGGNGGYSYGSKVLNTNTTLYINVGGKSSNYSGGYNGGGNGGSYATYNFYVSPGGGATHIATTSGLLPTLSSKQDTILIVAGGGGGGAKYSTSLPGEPGGGIPSNVSTCNTWTSSSTYTHSGCTGTFGQGYDNCGGGYTGGCKYSASNNICSGTGGTGYIGGVNDGKTSNNVRTGHGYARITLLSID